MKIRDARIILVLALVPLVLVCGEAPAQSSIHYRDRGNRSEGVKGLPVTGYAIELLSFRATYEEEPLPSGTTPPQYRLRFYLENADQVPYLAIRTYDNFRFYSALLHCHWPATQPYPVASPLRSLDTRIASAIGG
ncbi:MAG: hypothetical protein ACKVQT_03885 [Burkholderiales bacterium]